MTYKFTNISCMTHPFPCHIIYSHVQNADYSIAINTTKATIFCCECDCKIWIF